MILRLFVLGIVRNTLLRRPSEIEAERTRSICLNHSAVRLWSFQKKQLNVKVMGCLTHPSILLRRGDIGGPSTAGVAQDVEANTHLGAITLSQRARDEGWLLGQRIRVCVEKVSRREKNERL